MGPRTSSRQHGSILWQQASQWQTTWRMGHSHEQLPPPDDTHNALAWEGKLNIQKPKPFTGHDPQKCQGLEDALDCGPDPNIFSTLAPLLCTTVFAPDNLPAHLPSHSSTTLLLRITLLFSNNSIPTLVNSSTINNFINEFLAALAPQHL
ncbi:hypothetical protein E4T56_gene1632 [Termitomyces sp. T112]|nr:hypothetical protein E4T56_gene1632 [Termitomyces sp. T112]